jgi:hypothetical protein
LALFPRAGTNQNPAQASPVKDQEVEEINKSMASWNVEKQPTTFYQSRVCIYTSK